MPQGLFNKAQVLTKKISLNPNLNFSQIIQTSERDVGRRSQRLENEFGSLLYQQPPKEGRGSSYACPSLKN
jgi:hypothetical protein